MAKKIYIAPMLLAENGDIGLTDSQEGAWGGGGDTVYTDFWDWWNNDEDVVNNKDFLLEAGFDPYNEDTWAAFGFDPDNEDTWYGLFDYV